MFITGSTRTGKTKLVIEVVKLLKKLHIPSKVFVIASTRVAAFSIKGQTLHSFSVIHNTTNFDPQNLFEVIMRKTATRTWDKVEALVIDEISVVDSKLFDGLEFVARKLKEVDKRWGGI